MKFEVLTVATMTYDDDDDGDMIAVSSSVMLRSSCCRFGKTYRPHLQGLSILVGQLDPRR